jgi:hypothetical protein
MRKLLAVLAVTTIFGLASCGPTSSPTTPSVDPTSTPSISNPSTPDTPIQFKFNVKVEYENGDPMEGARVQACTLDETKCLMPVTTDENGECVLSMEMDTWVVHILNVPEGYSYDEDGYILGPDNSSVTIVLFTAQVARQW